jgi:hypothetical protein
MALTPRTTKERLDAARTELSLQRQKLAAVPRLVEQYENTITQARLGIASAEARLGSLPPTIAALERRVGALELELGAEEARGSKTPGVRLSELVVKALVRNDPRAVEMARAVAEGIDPATFARRFGEGS